MLSIHPKQAEFLAATQQRIHIPHVGPVVLTGHSRPGDFTHLHNAGPKPVTLVRQDGVTVTLYPGQAATLRMVGQKYRVACNDCLRADGTHSAECPRERHVDTRTEQQ